MKKQVRNERLLQLRRVILQAPPHRFKMQKFQVKIEGSCGSAYCAGGWAGLDPWFNAIGLHWDELSLVYTNSTGEEVEGIDALKQCFGLSKHNADYLFGGWLDPDVKYDITPQEVVANIDRIIADNKARPYRDEKP